MDMREQIELAEESYWAGWTAADEARLREHFGLPLDGKLTEDQERWLVAQLDAERAEEADAEARFWEMTGRSAGDWGRSEFGDYYAWGEE